jgi:NADPH:quinone reductase-like Zn-dependent oxidoreductase
MPLATVERPAETRARGSERVRAVVHDRYGPPEVLRLEEVERPVPKDDEILVKVHATTVNRTDCGLRSGKPFITRFLSGLPRPKQKILGSELSGEVEAVGAAVTEFGVGDRVFGVNQYGARELARLPCTRGVRLHAGEWPAGAQAERHELRRGRGRL